METNIFCDIFSLPGQKNQLKAIVSISAVSFVLTHNKITSIGLTELIFLHLQITHKYSLFLLILHMKWFSKRTRVPVAVHLKITQYEQQFCTSQFCIFLPTHSHIILSDQKKNVQPLLTKASISFTLQVEN